MSARNSVRISITVQVGDQVMTVTDSRPLFLSGDRRRWKRQIAEHVQEQSAIMGERFGGDNARPAKAARPD